MRYENSYLRSSQQSFQQATGAIGAVGSVATAAAQGFLNPVSDIMAVGNVFGSLSGLFSNKPSDFREWIYFDSHAHYSHTKGDKPNANTIGMATTVSQGLQNFVAQSEASGITFKVPNSFVINIGQRDNSCLWMPSSNRGDPYHGCQNQLAGPGDVQGTISAAIQWLQKYAVQSNAPAAVSSGGVTSSPVSASGFLSSPYLPYIIGGSLILVLALRD